MLPDVAKLFQTDQLAVPFLPPATRSLYSPEKTKRPLEREALCQY